MVFEEGYRIRAYRGRTVAQRIARSFQVSVLIKNERIVVIYSQDICEALRPGMIKM
jgi:hypothetical protein